MATESTTLLHLVPKLREKNWSKAEITNSNKKQLKSELTLNGKERILFDWELTKTMHTHLVEPELNEVNHEYQ